MIELFLILLVVGVMFSSFWLLGYLLANGVEL